VTSLNFGDDMVKLGISHRISQKVLDRSLPNYQHGRYMCGDD